MKSMSSILAVFPGQGSQHVGMGKDLFENFPIAREVFEEASDAIHVNLKKLCFEGPESDLALTEYTQPSLLVTSVAAFRVVEKELGLIPGAAAGHSLGEYSALVAIGSLKLADAARWVRERGIAMQKAVPAGEGTMAAILNLEEHQIQQICATATSLAQEKRSKGEYPEISVPALVEPANFNAPGQIVIAGSVDAVQEAVQLIKTSTEFSRAKAIPLQVSAPFHCALMEPARLRMQELFSLATQQQKPRVPNCPYIPNRTGRLSQEPGIVFEHLIEQVDHPVLWKQSMNTALSQPHPFTLCIEFGPGKALTGLMKRIAAHASTECALATVNDSSQLKTLEDLLKKSRSSEENSSEPGAGSPGIKRQSNTTGAPSWNQQNP